MGLEPNLGVLKMQKFATLIFLSFTTSFAMAADAPRLPQDAKKLKTAEIEAIYNDKTLSGEYYGDKSLIIPKALNSDSRGIPF